MNKDQHETTGGEAMTAVAAEALTKRFGSVVAVDDLSFTLAPGTVTGFLGPNGAGHPADAPRPGRADERTIVRARQAYADLDRPALSRSDRSSSAGSPRGLSPAR
jgi:hypothetical protein